MEMNKCMQTYPELYPEAAEDPEESEEIDHNSSEYSDKQIAEEKS